MQDPPSSQGTVLAKQKNWTLTALVIITMVTSSIRALVEDDTSEVSVLLILQCVLSAVLILIWCYLDSVEHGRHLGKVLSVVIVLVAVIGVPIYLLESRGIRGSLAIVLAGLFLALLILVERTSMMVTCSFVDLFGA